ncbi:choline transporter-like protein 2 isoform X2 [Ischnura elegans]|uniref:choline transporter-like protein 2 isoform X2 n=1 Tax=Ischnura elegans TaxID=197161 RepID=UPI001ED89BF1|nr:choline transporter-like protein 2 isoform X2 [Ischnura elegans]
MAKRSRTRDTSDVDRSRLKFDPQFNGPQKSRSCTDILCLLIFIVFLVAWAGVSIFAYKTGSPERLVFPTDSLGQQCGVDESVKDKKHLLFFDLSKCARPAVIVTGCPTPQVCVDKCPTQDFSHLRYMAPGQFNAAEVQSQLVCWYGFDKSKITTPELLQKAIDDHNCAPWYLASEASDKMSIGRHQRAVRNPLAGRCLPKVLSAVVDGGMSKIQYTMNGVQGTLNVSLDEMKNSTKVLAALSNAQEFDRKFVCYSEAFCRLPTTESSFILQFLHFGEMMLQDLTKIWPFILLGLAVAMLVCLVFILLMRWLAGIMVWFSVFGVLGLLSFAIYLCYSRYAELAALGDKKNGTVETKDLSLSPKDLLQLDLNEFFKIDFKSTLAKKETWMVFLIIAASILAIILLILIFLRNRIRIAIELIREASRAVGSVTSTLFFPIVPWLLQLVALAWGLSVALYLASSGKPEHRVTGVNQDCHCDTVYKPGDICIPDVFNQHCINLRTSDVSCGCQFFAHRTDKYVPWLHAFNLFGTLWLLFFISALGEMTLAGVFGAWYWTWNKAKGLPFFALTESVWRAFRYHLGTVAFGSLLIAICRFIRIMLEYIHHKLKKRDNKLVQCLLCCLRCCFWCLEKFLRFLNRNAYVMCAVHGTNFCKSAKDAFNLLMRNIVRVVVIDKVTDFLLFLGKILIVAGMGVASYYVFGHKSEELDKHVPQLHYFFLPIIVIALGTYFIASVFFGVYAMAVDTLFLCFLEDGERNDGSAEKPYFMSKNLMKILGKKNQFRDADKK